MNHRDLAIAAMRGLPVQHIPFIGRMELWYNFHHRQGTLPPPYEKASLWDIQRDLGIGIFGREAAFYRLVHPDVQIEQRVQGQTTVTQWTTPYGTLTCRDRMSAELHEVAHDAIRIEYPYKTVEDYDALLFFIEHAQVVETFEQCAELVNSIGHDGVARPSTGYVPAHQLMIEFMGYQTFYYKLHDHPAQVEALIKALTDQQRKILDLAAVCPATVIGVGANYDEQLTPPPIFDQFFAPFYREAKQVLATGGKIMVVHGDGEMDVLLKSLMDCGVEVVEAVTPKPMTSIDIRKTRRLWQDRVTMWGGVPCVLLTPTYSDEQFESYLEELFRAVAPGDRFILGFGDNVPTDGLFERVKRLAQFWQERGSYPLMPDT